MSSAKTGAGARDDGRLAIEADLGRRLLVGRRVLGRLEQRVRVRVGHAFRVRKLARGEVVDLVPHGRDGRGRERLVGAEDVAGVALPADLAEPACAALPETAVVGVGLVREPADEGHNLVRVHVGEGLGRHDGRRHGGRGDGRDGVGVDVVLCALLGERLGEADEAKLGGRVVGLAKVAVDASG